jgi:hypothetical protein
VTEGWSGKRCSRNTKKSSPECQNWTWMCQFRCSWAGGRGKGARGAGLRKNRTLIEATGYNTTKGFGFSSVLNIPNIAVAYLVDDTTDGWGQ